MSRSGRADGTSAAADAAAGGLQDDESQPESRHSSAVNLRFTPGKNPLVRPYFSPGKDGISMFERAGLTLGEELEVKKRKNSGEHVSGRSQKAAKRSASRTKPEVRRTVSEGMRSTKPGRRIGLANSKLQGATGSSISTADDSTIRPRENIANMLGSEVFERTMSKLDPFRFKFQGNRSTTRSDRISVFTPVTSMDAFVARPGLSTTVYDGFSQLDAYPSQNNSYSDLWSAQDTNATEYSDNLYSNNPSDRSTDKLGKEKCLTPATQKRADFEPRNQQQPLPRRSPVHLPTPGRTLKTIVEVPEPDSQPAASPRWAASRDNEKHNASFPVTDMPSRQCREIDKGGSDEEFAEFDDGLTEQDFRQLLDEEILLVPGLAAHHQNNDNIQAGNRPAQQSPAPFPSGSKAAEETGPTSTVSSVSDDQDFDDDWLMLDDDDIAALGLTEANGRSTTALQQVSGIVQGLPHRGEYAISQTQSRVITNHSSPTTPENAVSSLPNPIVRPPFPKPVRDRSPIIGLSATISLRTCFRVGEALNVGSRAVRENRTVIIELYARVRSSFREPHSVKQHFVFVDLFHDRPPYLDGLYECWKGVELYEHDSGRFLEPSDCPRMCRCIGKMKREGTTWKLTVLNIWEATTDDVDHVSGIIHS